ncbi:BCCT family transporter [Petrocella sp. FN5]|uniref:BCCT family transporter n=1 Tax=Petrocella sp. FN5 TaxID=3032002 RepID=UPI0023DCA4B1|nr:BCCT family transporter [Petrocella sp. FN5]MDF1616880.1 BCCT family transporter [Petrocella sp. FN5]
MFELIIERIRNKVVFILSILIISATSLWGIFSPDSLGKMASSAFGFLVTRFGWFYLLSVSIFLFFCIYLIFSPYRNLKLGQDESKPQFSNFSWFAMLFSAGMAIGLIFWGVAEPLSHFINPPYGLAEAGSQKAAELSLRFSFFHWGLHAWANYALFGLAIAYFQLRKGYPGLVSSIFIPIIGERHAKGIIGMLIDLLAIFATVTGIATDLGLGTLQINSGLNMLYNVPETRTVQVIIILVATVCFITSAVKGLDKGIKKLSVFNLVLSIFLLVIAVVIGPQLEMAKGLIKGIQDYGLHFIGDGLPWFALKDHSEWLGNWTIFYWAWWIAWTPFVGTFIARISWGRTIKEFILGVLFIPTLGSMVWFCVFGVLGTHQGLEVAKTALTSIPTAYFTIMDWYPLSGLISFVTVLLLFIFFVTSADSSTFVLGIYTSGGNPNPSTKKKVAWGVTQSFLALALLLAGGLEVLQTANIVAAFPFAIIMLLSIVALMKSLREEVVTCTTKLKTNKLSSYYLTKKQDT